MAEGAIIAKTATNDAIGTTGLINSTRTATSAEMDAALGGVVSKIDGGNGVSGTGKAGTRADVSTNTSISKIDLNAGVDDGMQYVKYQKDDNWVWPDNLGFKGAKVETVLPVGTKLDRIGEPTGSFLAPAGSSYEARALAPGSGASLVYEYVVIKPFPVIQGEIAPAFGQSGGGIQILPNVGQRVNIEWLVKNGYLREIKK